MLNDPSGWGELLTALAAFVLTHSIPARPAVRGRLVAVLGPRIYLLSYSAVSLLILIWLVAAVGAAPYLELWPRQDWQTSVPAVGMLFACILVVSGLTSPNPLSFGAGRRGFDPDRPGVAGVVRHPILWATLLWSLTHLVPNGDVSHVLMFGLFAALSAGSMLMLDRRLRRTLGDPAWQDLARRTSNLPLTSLAKGWRPRFTVAAALRLAAGIALYLLLLISHGLITGIPVVWPF